MPEIKQKHLIIAFVVVLVITILSIWLYYRYHKPSEKFISLMNEPSLTCQLTNSNSCHLSTGVPGVCDSRTERCVELPYWAKERQFRIGYQGTHLGEISQDCLWRDVCSRDDGTMGVCMSGLCYPNSHLAQ